MQTLIAEGRAPSIIALENVCGTLTSHGGKDFAAICDALQQEGYRFGAMVIDAALFVPHSRPRLFVIALRAGIVAPAELFSPGPSVYWHSQTLRRAYEKLSVTLKKDWIWWALPTPPIRKTSFSNIIEDNPLSVRWHTPEETRQLMGMMSDLNLAKVKVAQCSGRQIVGCIYKRTRQDETGCKVQRAEIRFDDISGCLRTPAGGSSRQIILIVDGSVVKSRLISSRETARLMGLPDDYLLPKNYNEAYHLTGDGVVVPVVRHLAENIFEQILADQSRTREAA
jgi:DNA (cytosine-5)-methyltransferase 1